MAWHDNRVRMYVIHTYNICQSHHGMAWDGMTDNRVCMYVIHTYKFTTYVKATMACAMTDNRVCTYVYAHIFDHYH